MRLLSDFVNLIVLGVGFVVSTSLIFYFVSEKRFIAAVWSGFAAWVCLGVALVFVIIPHLPGYSDTETHGYLIPGRDPTPPHAICPNIPDRALKIFWGNSVSYTESDNQTLLRVLGRDLISVRRIGNAIAVSATVFGADGRVVADIRDNEFTLNPNNYFRRTRPDPHTLTVHDQSGAQVLFVKYLNRYAIHLLGIFNTPAGRIVIRQDRQQIIGTNFSRVCIGGSRIAVNVE